MLDIPGLKTNIALAPFTTYKIGGPADFFVIAQTKDELVQAITEARKNKIPYFILGTGANILFGDKGFRGLIIKNEAMQVVCSSDSDSNIVIADSGVSVADLIQITAEKNLSGFEHFAGIPSSVGGAIWQNLHFLAPDRKNTIFIESIVESAEILDEENIIQKVDRNFFNFGYDYSILHDQEIIVLEVTFNLEPKEKSLIEKQAQENMAWRNEKQPQLEQFPSCGSVFKKIKGVGAGRLIDKVGLKGFTIGGAQISEKHANYIVNNGNATAEDVRSIIKTVQEKVFSETGYSLQTEISFIGEF